MASEHLDKLWRFSQLPYEVQWRAGLVKLPWLVPRSILHLTAPDGPFPELLYLPSRGRYFIPVYLFCPIEHPGNTSELPVHLDFHGGGFFMGSCLEQAPWCGMVARNTGRIVISIDYRKGPLDKFPAAIEDAEDVLRAILDTRQETEASKVLRSAVAKRFRSRLGPDQCTTIDANDISLSGFSSGGNIALNLMISVQYDGEEWPSLFAGHGRAVPTLLFYPSFDSRQLPHERPRPHKMGPESSSWFSSIGSVLGPTYLPREMREHPRASPGLNSMKDSLSERSRVLLILPEIDTLASQSDVWVEKMKSEGLDSILTVCREPDMAHGWTQFPDKFLDRKSLERKYAVLQQAVDFLKKFGAY